jgi:hypothetical protein
MISVLWIRRDLTGKIRDKPEQLFTMANYVSWTSYIFVFVVIVWSKRVFMILRIPYRPARGKVIE